jgi:hypothetical protein
MGKDAYWFPHDSNARGDKKCVRIRRKYGWAAYGIYWAIVEQLRDEGEYMLPVDSIDDMCFEIGCDPEIVHEMITAGLLQEEGGFFFSKSLKRRMVEWDEKKKRRAAAGRLGGLKKSSNAKAMLKQSQGDAKAKPKQCSSKKSTEQKSTEQKSTEQKSTEQLFCPESSADVPAGINPEIWHMLVECYSDRLSKLKAGTVATLGKNLSDPIYSGVNVPVHIRKALHWEQGNPSRKKTPRGVPKFLTGWMGRAQDNGTGGGQTPKETPAEAQHRRNMEVLNDARRRDGGGE